MNTQASISLARLPCPHNPCQCLLNPTTGALLRIAHHGLVVVGDMQDVAGSCRMMADVVGSSLLFAAGRFDASLMVRATPELARPCTARLAVDIDARSFVVTVARR